jgi:hypothetical protein
MRLVARMDADRYRLKLRDDADTTAEGSQIAGEGGRLGPRCPGARREPHGGSGYAPIGPGRVDRAVAKRLMVQLRHEEALYSPMARALGRQHPAEHRIVVEGAGKHPGCLRRISVLGHPYLKTSHARQHRPVPPPTVS